MCKKISSIQRRFIWAWGDDHKHILWVRWEKVCKSKEEGGLRVKDIRMFNCALLAKWNWRLLSEEKGKWKEILASKYYTGGVRTQDSSNYYSWWWRDLSRACDEGEGDKWFQKSIEWKVGASDKVRFREDVWLENNKLITLFPRLFSILLDQGKTVAEVGTWEDVGWNWRLLRWRRPRFNWESSMEEEFKDLCKEFKDICLTICLS